MKHLLPPILTMPPALVYFLNQLDFNDIAYKLYGTIPDSDMAFVDLDVDPAAFKRIDKLPEKWKFISPHFMAQRAIAAGFDDPIQDSKFLPEEIVIAFGGKEAEQWEHFQALCQQVNYLRQRAPSRLIYNHDEPPTPEEIQALIGKLITAINDHGGN